MGNVSRLLEAYGITSYDMLLAKLWDNKQQTRKYKKKLPRKKFFTGIEKQREYLKHKWRIGQFKKRGT